MAGDSDSQLSRTEIMPPGCPKMRSSEIVVLIPVRDRSKDAMVSMRTCTISIEPFDRLGCSRMDDIFRLRESGDAGRGEKEKRMSAGAESARLCHDFGFEGDAGRPLKAPREPDFLCLNEGFGPRARSRSIIDDLGAGMGMSKGLGTAVVGRFFEGRRVRAFLVVCRKDDRFLRCISTGEPGTCDGFGASSSTAGSNASRSTVFESVEGIGQL